MPAPCQPSLSKSSVVRWREKRQPSSQRPSGRMVACRRWAVSSFGRAIPDGPDSTTKEVPKTNAWSARRPTPWIETSRTLAENGKAIGSTRNCNGPTVSPGTRSTARCSIRGTVSTGVSLFLSGPIVNHRSSEVMFAVPRRRFGWYLPRQLTLTRSASVGPRTRRSFAKDIGLLKRPRVEWASAKYRIHLGTFRAEISCIWETATLASS
jgi:hypothetical protein